MDSSYLERAARRVLSQHQDKASGAPLLVEIESVSTSDFVPPSKVLHDGRVGKLGPEFADICDDTRQEAELRSALTALVSVEDRQPLTQCLSAKDVLYLDMLCDGLNDSEAAERLSISLRAIKARKKAICEKTRSSTINQAVAKYALNRKTRTAPVAKCWPGPEAEKLLGLGRVERSITQFARRHNIDPR